MSAQYRLSICIPTLNRARFIGETLDSIVDQLTPDVEIVIVDGGSSDGTGDIVKGYADRFGQIRYFNTGTGGVVVPNAGFDRDCDFSVEQAQGEHCWLFSDDDLFVPGAIEEVLRSLDDGDPDLLIVDAQVRDLSMTRTFEPSRLKITERTDYRADDRDAFLAAAGNSLTFLGVVIIRRSCWMARDRQAYYGSLFMHVGVIFQSPPIPLARILPRSLVIIRMGNAMWTDRSFEIWMVKWPALIWGFAGYSDQAKASVVAKEPWRPWEQMLVYRAYGSFRREQFRRFLSGPIGGRARLQAWAVLAIPGVIAHVLETAIQGISRSRGGSIAYNLLIASRNSNPLSRAIGRIAGRHILPPKR